MATKAQYEFFKAGYQEEAKRYGELAARARTYFTVLTFALGALVLKGKDLAPENKVAHAAFAGLCVAATAFLGVAMVLVVRALRIRAYQGAADLQAIRATEFKDEPPEDATFYALRLVDFAAATQANTLQNDRVAERLNVAVWCITLAVSILGVALVLELLAPLVCR